MVVQNRPNVRAGEDWPHYQVTDYTRVIDYDAQSSREDYTRQQGNYPKLGRVPMPEQHVTAFWPADMSYELGDFSYAQGNQSADMLMVYLPKGKILFNADCVFATNTRGTGADLNQHVPVHGRPGTNDEFVKLVGIATSSRS